MQRKVFCVSDLNFILLSYISLAVSHVCVSKRSCACACVDIKDKSVYKYKLSCLYHTLPYIMLSLSSILFIFDLILICSCSTTCSVF